MRRPTSTPPELPGYTFVNVLGSGGFSDVFLYDQQLPKRRVAVKVLLTEELSGANRAAFVAEANVMAQLSAHPYIVSIFHADVAKDGRPYFVMEYCSGPSLAERYKARPLEVADVLRTGIRVAGAVATAHSAGILHRDIKPANILTNDYGWPALTDFGISSTVDDDLAVHTTTLSRGGDTGGTSGGTSVGMSVPWSPPEMFEDDPKPDIRADVFSLAATMYTLLAGHTPFELRGRSNGTLDLIGRIERGAITPFDREDIPRSLVAVLHKGMATHRDDRFATAVDFARALQRVELELGYAPTTIDVPNLVIAAPEAIAGDSSEDETRVRGVATIEAQTAAAQPAASAGQVDDVATETVVRARPVQAEPAVSRQPEPELDAPVKSRGRTLAIVGTAVAVLVLAAAVTVGIIFFGGRDSEATTPTAAPPPGGNSAIVETVPVPTLVSATESGGAIEFTVEHAKAKEGDSYRWQRMFGRENEPVQASKTGTFTVDGFTGGEVCVEVWVVRDGRQSPDPLQGCYPQ
ncbi:serine/threonine-protein kinase [Cryobacterium sp. BB736]|uniref:serine/threonine-protein kinase n=1 Tax=Cryobacterium sp. BB736 TaxID=2746963 RepID=UPI0018743050|nr:serine/threonine-protein kinase [Cryobacterium sp. BB736]